MMFIQQARWYLFILFLTFSGVALGQQYPAPIRDSLISSIEDLIVQNDYASAKSLLKSDSRNAKYHDLLTRVVDGAASFDDFQLFYESITNRIVPDYQGIHDFLERILEEPQKTEIDIDYVILRWNQIDNASNQLLDIDLGNRLQEALENYVNRFDVDDPVVEKANILLYTHRLNVMAISEQAQKGMEQAVVMENRARASKDTTLIILSLYHKCDFLYFQRDLKGYIAASDEAYLLDKVRQRKSPYYASNLVHLIDSERNLDGNEERLITLLDVLASIPKGYYQSFFLYMDYLSELPKNSPFRKQVFNKFGVDTGLDLAHFFEQETTGKLGSLYLRDIAKASAKFLIVDGYKEEAIEFVNKANRYTQEAYSNDLGRALARYETDLITKEKEKELALEKEKAKTSIVIAAGIGLLLLLVIYAYVQKSSQNRQIKEKNDRIVRQNEEKELLLKEIHHRVKNNLQVVSSLLDLQSRGIEDEKALSTFMEGQNRVKAMALIHQKLYQEDDLATINFGQYAEQLAKELTSLYPSAKGIRTRIDADSNAQFDIDTAVPLGLILNELISNAYKYAFQGNEVGELSISVKSLGDGKHELTVTDTGAGLPSGFDFSKAGSLGLRLVRRLAKQLYGKVEYIEGQGAKFVVIFKETFARKAV